MRKEEKETAVTQVRLFGTGETSGKQAVFARAALLHDSGGRATLDGDLLVAVARRLKRGEGDMDVILVADDAAQALLLRVPMGLHLVGVVAEKELAFAPSGEDVTVIGGVTGAREKIIDGNLLIIDPDGKRVLVEPDADEFARLQALPHRPRVLLGAAHIPAFTQDGRAVAVWALVATFADIETAQRQGADGLLVAAPGEIISADDSEATLANLLRVVELTGGGDLCIAAALDVFDLEVAAQIAEQTTLRWAIPAGDLPMTVADLRADLAPSDDISGETAKPPPLPRLVGDFRATFDALPDLTGWDDALVSPAHVADLTLPDTFDLPPLWVALSDLDAIPQMVAVGAAGLVVAPDQIAGAKDFIREQS